MNSIAIGLIALGLVLLLVGILSFRNHRKRGLAFSIAGVISVAIPFIATYLVSE